MKKSVSTKIAAALYAIAGVFMLVCSYPIMTLNSLAQMSTYILFQMVAAIFFVKIAVNMLDKTHTKTYGTSFFVYNLLFIVFTGVSYEVESVVFKFGVEYFGLTVSSNTILYILLGIKLVLIAMAALFATMEDKKEEIQVEADTTLEEVAGEGEVEPIAQDVIVEEQE